MKTKTKTPAGGPGVDSDAGSSAGSVTNSPPFHGERKGAVEDFVAEMYRYVPPELSVLKMQFRGDPNSDIYGKWRAQPLGRNARVIDDRANVYFTVAAFRKDGTYRRRKEQFGGGILLMIDDLGDGPGAKFPLSKIDELPPTARIETSPDNFQAIFMFDRLVTDQAQFNALIDAFVREKFRDKDTGMKGVTRVFRPPFGINGKKKYKRAGQPWRVRLAEWAPQCRYSVDEIVKAFGLELSPERDCYQGYVPTDVADTRIDYFNLVARELHRLGMVRESVGNDDWLNIRCPWVDDHTGGVDNGAAIATPSSVNDWHGGFHCHHGHCAERGWRELTQWLADESAEVMDQINRAAPEWLENDR